MRRDILDDMTRRSVDQERRARRGELPPGRASELDRYWRGLAERAARRRPTGSPRPTLAGETDHA